MNSKRSTGRRVSVPDRLTGNMKSERTAREWRGNMDKQTMAKSALLLDGLSVRLAEDFIYLEEIRGMFTSGIRQTAFFFRPEGELLHFRMGAESRLIDPADFTTAILSEASRQDAFRLEFVARGETLLLEAGSGKTSLRTVSGASLPREATKYASGIPIASLHGGGMDGGTSPIRLMAGGLLTNRDYLVKPGQADKLLREIGIMADNGKIRNDRIRKYNQIDHFVELLVPLLETLGREKRELFIVDCACGKSYLSFVLNHYVREVMHRNARFLGLDIAEGVIDASRETAKRLGYRNMEFHCGDLRELLVEDGGPVDRVPDLVISLHACDVATDYALAFGMRNRAKAIVSVPCCQHELVNKIRTTGPMAEILRFGPLKARLADTLTDGLRCLMLEAGGYEVSCVEWVSPLETPKNLMIRAEWKGEPNPERLAAYRSLAAPFGADLTLASEMLGFL